MDRWHVVAVSGLYVLSLASLFPPKLGKGLPSNFEQAEVEFKKRIATQFPVGSSESTLVGELRREGFRIEPLNSAATPEGFLFLASHGGSFPCELSWRVLWRADAGRLTREDAHYDASCP